MLARILTRAALVIAVPAMLLAGCAGESPTGLDEASFAKGAKPVKVSLANLALETTTLIIDGVSINYTVDIVNGGGKLSGDHTLQAVLTQAGTPTAIRGAGGTQLLCGVAGGGLPHGTCTMRFTTLASNTTGGPGTLVPGPALWTLSVLDPQGLEMTSMQVQLTLQ
jgi:hypothetical protein